MRVCFYGVERGGKESIVFQSFDFHFLSPLHAGGTAPLVPPSIFHGRWHCTVQYVQLKLVVFRHGGAGLAKRKNGGEKEV